MPEQPAADWPHDEADRKQHRRIQLLYDRIIAREKRAGKIERKGRVGIKIVPFDEIADGSDEDRPEAAPHIGKLEPVIFQSDRVRSHGFARIYPRNAILRANV